MAYDLTSNPQGRHTVTAFFDDQANAEKARADLLAGGFSAGDITVKAGAEAASDNAAEHRQGILSSLVDIFVFMPPHDQLSYAEGLRRGGVALAVHTMPETYERAIDILDRDGAVDLDERELEWRQESSDTAATPARPGAPGSAEQAGFEGANQHDALVNPAANHDVRERIGVGTSDMTVGSDLNPGNAVGDAASTPMPITPTAAAPGSVPPGSDVASRDAMAPRRDTTHGRRRIRSYVSTSAEAMPAGPDPQI